MMTIMPPFGKFCLPAGFKVTLLLVTPVIVNGTGVSTRTFFCLTVLMTNLSTTKLAELRVVASFIAVLKLIL